MITLQGRNLADTILTNQMINVSITCNGTKRYHVSLDIMHRGHNITAIIFLPKTPELYCKETSDKLKLRTFFKVNYLHS